MTEIETTDTSLTVGRTFDTLRDGMFAAWTDPAHKRLNAMIGMKDTDRETTRKESR